MRNIYFKFKNKTVITRLLALAIFLGAGILAHGPSARADEPAAVQKEGCNKSFVEKGTYPRVEGPYPAEDPLKTGQDCAGCFSCGSNRISINVEKVVDPELGTGSAPIDPARIVR